MNHVVNGRPSYCDVRLHIKPDTFVFFYLGHRGPDHIHQRHRLIPASGWIAAGHNEQVLRVAVHARSDVIHLEQAGQAVPVPLSLLKPLYDAHLTFRKGLAALRQVYAHRVETAAGGGLARRQPQHFPAHLVEGARNLAYLVRGVNTDWFGVRRPALAIVLGDTVSRAGQLGP